MSFKLSSLGSRYTGTRVLYYRCSKSVSNYFCRAARIEVVKHIGRITLSKSFNREVIVKTATFQYYKCVVEIREYKRNIVGGENKWLEYRCKLQRMQSRVQGAVVTYNEDLSNTQKF